jgi:DNA-binding IclR family transcriptional regulator
VPEYKNRSVTRALSVLDVLFDAARGLLLTEIAAMAELDRATAYRLLHVLIEHGYVHRDARGKRYSINVNLSFRSKGELPGMVGRLSRPVLRQLHIDTGAAVSVASLLGAEICYYQEYLGRDQISDELFRGKRLPSHATACGKMMLALQPPSALAKIYEYLPLQPYTAQTIRELPALERDLSLVREYGFATNQGEFVENRVCVALPIRTVDGTRPLAVSVSLPAAQVDRKSLNGLVDRLRTTSGQISRLLGTERDGILQAS